MPLLNLIDDNDKLLHMKNYYISSDSINSPSKYIFQIISMTISNTVS